MSLELSILMPCRNEAATVGRCVGQARAFLERHGVSGEVVVADNGSGDGSGERARAAGARVVEVARTGYGEALRAGLRATRGRYIVMGDCDESYDFGALLPFLERLRAGDDLVVGNRFRGSIAPGAMPVLHRYVGNPVLSLVARTAFGVPIGDVYCGLRGLSREACERLELQSTGMEFALEMIVKATLLKLRLSEVPVDLARDGRDHPSHLSTWRDGRRSLLLYLASSPNGLFLYPGLALLLGGLVVGTLLVFGALRVGSGSADTHALLCCAGAVLIGFQLASYSLFLRFLMVSARLLPPDPVFIRRMSFRLESGLIVGAALALAGGLAGLHLFRPWSGPAFDGPDTFGVLRLAIPAATALVLGLQVIAASLFLALLKWQHRARWSST